MEPNFYDENIALSLYDDTEENYDQQEPQYQTYDINLNQVYSPLQPLLKKNESLMVPFELEPQHIKRKAVPLPSIRSKKVCTEPASPEETHQSSSTASNSDLDSSDLEPPACDLDILVHSIGREQVKVPHVPTQLEVTELWERLDSRFRPSEAQEQFLSKFLKKEQLLKIKFALDDDIVNGPETQQFQEWVEGICLQDNAKIIKDMARRQKVYRYLEKKHGRTYSKKVHYQIRQRVAEERLRVKGRFVTWTQALDMLQESNKKQYNVSDYYTIKKKLKERFGSCRSKA